MHACASLNFRSGPTYRYIRVHRLGLPVFRFMVPEASMLSLQGHEEDLLIKI
jgi:hypothetical protein